MKRSLKTSAIVFLVIELTYVSLLMLGAILVRNKAGNGYFMMLAKAISLTIVTVSYFFVMHKLRVEMAKFDESGLESELNLVKTQQRVIGFISAAHTATMYASALYLLIERYRKEDECTHQIFWATTVGQPIQLIFRFVPSTMIMASHIKNY
mmetsp:Transcript_31707/g.39470  ORF Transcript_31707/g.39470 Transcript_31707/m.39470 type:complete len:152 (-) Transcript_31707:500-955(-)